MPLLLGDAIAGLGFGQQVTVAATVFIAVLYLFRGRKAAGRAVGVAGRLWFAAVAFGVGTALVILLGWVDPNVGAFADDISAALGAIVDTVGDFVADRVDGLLDSVLPEWLY
jgi:hypothetical protein